VHTATRKIPVGICLAGAIWLIATGTAMFMITRNSVSPGDAGSPPTRWPTESSLEHSADKPTLLLFLHPHCPCSRATLGELELLLANCHNSLNTIIVFAKPSGTPADWMRSDLWQTARRTRGVVALSDEEGCESERFAAETSGTALLYNQSGDLLFHGGITGARGHSGDNAGRDAVLALLGNPVREAVETSVFGCPLFDRRCSSTRREPSNE
jgi:hypothetical protein